MLFETSDRVKKALPQIRAFVREELVPLESEFKGKSFREMIPALREKQTQVKKLGFWAPHMPEAYGGMGLSLFEFATLSQELGWCPIGHYVFNCQAPDAGNMEILKDHGTDAQKEQFLKPLVQGDIRSCFSMTEPEFAGSNPVHMATTAVKEGDDYIITGHKWFTTAADGASFAVVMAITDAESASPYARASQIIVPVDTEGFELVRNISIMGEEGDDYMSHAEIRYHGCRVPQSNRIGAEGAGFLIAQERLGPGRIHHCMRWIGISERALDLMCRRAATRELAPGKPLGSKQTIQNWIAESRAEINASRLMVLQAAKIIDEQGAYKAREEISLIKFYVAGMMQRVLDRSIQTHGALGITDETPLAFWWRHERGARIYDGPDEVHKSVVARRILKGYGIKIA